MTPHVGVRLADPERDAVAVAGIYRPAVESHVSFEETCPDAAEMAGRMSRTLQRTPWLVAESATNGAVVGYAYASAHRERAGYRWSVDVSVYVDAAWQRHGVGRMLYDHLLVELRRQHFVNAYAGVALPNPSSVALHGAVGMKLIGIYERVGFKNGEWLDVAWFGMRLIEPDDPPSEPIALPELVPPP